VTALPQKDAGRELDALVEIFVFGRCDHVMAYVTTDELKSRARREIMAEWQEKYGKQPPDDFIMAEAESRVWLQEEGDYAPKECTRCGVTAYGTRLTPKYSTDIAAAWEIITKLHSDATTYFQIEWSRSRWEAIIRTRRCGTWSAEGGDSDGYLGEATAKTAPHAICLAALKAVGYE
jgi:ABA sandwich protein